MNQVEADYEVNIPLEAYLPVYRHLVGPSKIDIDILYGGRDSGKSRFIASILVTACLHLKYFRCMLVRKTFNTIKDSQWQMIRDVCESWGIEDLFVFNVSPLEIRCLNGNRFISRGMDEPAKIKSASNVSHAWAEEGNEFNMDDFIVLMSTLRTNVGKVKTWFSFNPEADVDFSEFWIYTTFYAKYNGNIYANFTGQWQINLGDGPTSTETVITYRSTHTTYHDNPYATPVRRAFLEYLKELDPYYYQVYTLGKWGNRRVGDPYCLTFDTKKHVRHCAADPLLPMYLSFDFNVNPITCGVYQNWDEPGNVTRVICPKAFKLSNSNIYELCDAITLTYPGFIYLITGDATGQNTTALVQDAINYYTVIKTKLQLTDTQIRVPSINPKVEENRMLVNAAFKQLDISFDPVGAKDLIFDCQYVSVDDMGKIDKGSRTNPRKRADHLDHWRYYLNTNHKNILYELK